MSYQLPQELQTKKLNSLPDDLRAAAEELVAKKFGIAEIMSEGRYENKDRIQDPFSLPNNMIQLVVFFDRGYQYRFHLPLAASALSDYPQTSSSTYYGEPARDRYKEDLAHEVIRRTEDHLHRYLSSREARAKGRVRHIEVEMNGYRQVINSLDEIGRIIYERLV